jgi:hypothetical protein
MKHIRISALAAIVVTASQVAPVAITEAQANVPNSVTGKTAENVWRLRSGLNVAALSCKNSAHKEVVPSYSEMLTRHKSLLAAAYKSETQRHGVKGFDRSQTVVYNRFSNQASPDTFCRTAADVAQQSNAMDSAALSANASSLVAELERGLQ